MGELIETRWKRYGKDRVYVKTIEGDEVGHVDLVERTVVAKIPDYDTQLEACLARWLERCQSPAPRPEPPTAPVGASQEADVEPREDAATRAELGVGCRDLAANVAGAAVRAKRDEVNSEAPVLNFVARLLGAKTEERAWRVGAKGEQKVARQLAKLGPGWHVLHAVEVGSDGADIDHVVIGPPGVFTLNTKRRPGGKVWVGERAVLVNGHRTDYLRNSRHEGKRACRLLSAGCGRPVGVTPAIVFVDLEGFTVKQMPADVHVTTRRRLVDWLRSLPAALDEGTVGEIFAVARRSATWD